MNSTLQDWLKISTPEQRKIFFDGVFEVFNSTSANTFGDISVKSLPKLFSTYKEISEDDRKVIMKMLKLFGKSYFTNLKNAETEKLNEKFSKKSK